MPSPADLHVARERRNIAEHDAIFAQKLDEYGLTAALLTYATVLAVPEGEPYDC